LAHFLDDQWTEELSKDWTEAYGVVASVMIDAAAEATRSSPPWWDAEIVAHDRRSLDVAVLQVKPYFRLPFVPGQSVAVQCHLRPRQWRFLSPANAPRVDGTIDLHVKHIPGGHVSAAMVQALRVGDVLRLGSAVGERLTLTAGRSSDLLMIAGGHRAGPAEGAG
jgi:NAD(P)H-flavin reductase